MTQCKQWCMLVEKISEQILLVCQLVQRQKQQNKVSPTFPAATFSMDARFRYKIEKRQKDIKWGDAQTDQFVSSCAFTEPELIAARAWYDKIKTSKWKNKFWTQHTKEKSLQIRSAKLIKIVQKCHFLKISNNSTKNQNTFRGVMTTNFISKSLECIELLICEKKRGGYFV